MARRGGVQSVRGGEEEDVDKKGRCHAADWDERSTLVFREVRQCETVSLSEQPLQHVDITVNTDLTNHSQTSSNHGVHRHDDVTILITLAWTGDIHPESCTSVCTLTRFDDVTYSDEDVTRHVMKKFTDDNFSLLRDLVRFVYSEYRTRVVAVRRIPLRLELIHTSKTSAESLKNDHMVLQRHLIDLGIMEGDNISVSIELQGDATADDTSTYQLSNEGTPSKELHMLEKKLMSQMKSIKEEYRTQITENETILSSVRRLLTQQKQMMSEADSQSTQTRRAHPDGEEADGNALNNKHLYQKGVSRNKSHTNVTTLETKTGDGHSVERKGEDQRDATLSKTSPPRDSLAVSNSGLDDTDSKSIRGTSKGTQRVVDMHAKKQHESKVKLPEKVQTSRSSSRTFSGDNENSSESNTAALSRSDGMDTFICFDSSSRKYDRRDDISLQEMKDIALSFIEEVETIAVKHGVEENIGLIYCRDETFVSHTPSNDYASVRMNVGKLVHGRVGLSETLKFALNFLLTKGSPCQVDHGYEIKPRLIIITNYGISSNETDQCLKLADSDDLNSTLQRLNQEERLTNPIWIPAGQVAHDLIRLFSQASGGLVLNSSQTSGLSKYYSKDLTIGKVTMFIKNNASSLTGNLDVDLKFMMGMFGSHLEIEDKAEVESFLRARYGGSAEQVYHKERPNLPTLGSRVTRGQDWHGGDTDSGGPGTIIGHLDQGMVVVEWDNGPAVHYRYGAEGCYDVKVVTDRPRLAGSGFTLDVGCEVQRGPDWNESHGDEDGGSGRAGVVFMSNEDGLVKVRWHTTGHIGKYCVGRDGKVEVVMREMVGTHRKTDLRPPKRDHEMLSEKRERSLTMNTNPIHRNTNSPQLEASSSVEQEIVRDVAVGKSDRSVEQEIVRDVAVGKSDRSEEQRTSGSSQESNGGIWVWQWEGNGVWQTYPRDVCDKLEASYQRRPEGSCLITKDNTSFRVIFKSMEEKDISTNSRLKVRRIKLSR